MYKKYREDGSEYNAPLIVIDNPRWKKMMKLKDILYRDIREATYDDI